MNFKELLTQINIETAPEGHHHTTPGWIQFDCPFCGLGTKKYHMGYSISGHFVHCWHCGRHSIVDALVAHTQMSPRECYAMIKQLDKVRRIPEQKLTGTKLLYPKGVCPLRKSHKDYIRSRDLKPKIISELYEVQGIKKTNEKTSQSLFIPIISQGVIVSWTSRSILEDNWSRYISAKPEQELIRHKTLLYNEDAARHAILITEGPIDVWRFGPGAVATFGIALTIGQVNRMTHYPIRAICFDSDRESQKMAAKLFGMLSERRGETYNIELDSKDLGSASHKEINRIKKLLHL